MDYDSNDMKWENWDYIGNLCELVMSSQSKGLFLIILSALMFGSYGVWSKLIGGSLGALFQGWTRGLFLAIILLPILLWKKELIPIEKKDWKWMGLFLVFTSLTQAPIFYAFNHMDIGTASLLFFVSQVLMLFVVGIFFLGEKLTKIKLLSFILALAGMSIVFQFSLVVFTLLAAAMAVLNGIASGGEVGFSKKLSEKYSPLYLSWLSWVIIVITNAPISYLLGETWILPSFEIVWIYQLGYTIVSLIGFWAVMEGLKTVEASIGGLIGLMEVVFTIGFGIILFSEELSTKVIIGGALIMVAAGLPHLVEMLNRNTNHTN